MTEPIGIPKVESKSRLDEYLSRSPQFGTPEPPIVLSHVDDSTIPRRLRTSDSLDLSDVFTLDEKNESKVLVLYTGGTIGMVRNAEGTLAPQPHAMEAIIRATINMHDDKYSNVRFSNELRVRAPRIGKHSPPCLLPLVLPNVPNHKRVIYTIYEYDPLLDSSNMTMDDWITIAKDIKGAYEHFDGFVILHGTDTLAYTASALSFMLENLGKPVIITGSQIPCFETRSDGRDNFIGALILAGNYNIPEVTVYFNHKLLRGNRTIKISSENLHAFDSPNMPALVKAGIGFEVDHKAIYQPKTIQKFRVHSNLNRNVVLLRLFPSINSETLAHFMTPPIQGVVLQCYGAGNIPSNRKDILKSIQEAVARGVIILSVTQCSQGGVSPLYETGKALMDVGVLPGCDITPEAALTKLAYVLSKEEWSLEEKRERMLSNIAGEITVLNLKSSLQNTNTKTIINDLELIQEVAKSLKLTTSLEIKAVEKVLYPSILCSTVYKGDLKTIKELKKQGVNLAVCDYDMRTPLHVAASEGNADIVEYLLKNGAGVHARDRNNDSPLRCAINGEHAAVIECLVNCGAHLLISQPELGEILCSLARQGKMRRIQCFQMAGANLNTKNLSHQTPLHSAVETGQIEVVEYLIAQGMRTNEQNWYGQTPLAIATVLRRTEIADLLRDLQCAF